MRLGAIGVILLVGCGLSGGADREPLGVVAFSQGGDGDLVVKEVAGGDARVIDDAGPFGGIVFSLDGTEMAYANANREVFIATLDGDVRAVGGTGSYLPGLHWEVGGWLWYSAGAGSRHWTTIVLPGSATTRQVGSIESVRIAGSPVEPRLAYLDCLERAYPCLVDLVVERPDGSERVVLATGIVAEGVQFTPDGSRVITAEQRGDEYRAIARAIDGSGSAVDLGPTRRDMYTYGPDPGLSLFSPDGTEILSMDGTTLVALRLDGSGARTIAAVGQIYAWRAGFTPAGDVLYMKSTNTEQPPDDTPEFAYTTRIVDTEGTVRTLRELDPACTIALVSFTAATVSSDTSLLAYECGIVQRISDGKIVAELGSGGSPLGFTPGGGVLYLAYLMAGEPPPIVLVRGSEPPQRVGDTFGYEIGRPAAFFNAAR